MSNFTNEFLKYYLTNPLIIPILVLGLISAIFYKQIIGWFGEHWTKKALSKLPKAKYKIINNLFLSVNGLTHQIDHVIISPYGIFCSSSFDFNRGSVFFKIVSMAFSLGTKSADNFPSLPIRKITLVSCPKSSRTDFPVFAACSKAENSVFDTSILRYETLRFSPFIIILKSENTIIK